MSDPDPKKHADPAGEDRALELQTEKEARAQARVGRTVRGGGDQVPDASSGESDRRDADTAKPLAANAGRTHGKPDQLAPQVAEAEDRQEALIDEGVEETFPASDAVSVKRIT